MVCLIFGAFLQVTETMRRDILTKNERIAELDTSLAEQKNSYEAKLKAVTQKLETSLSQKKLQLQESEANYQEQVDALKKELKVQIPHHACLTSCHQPHVFSSPLKACRC